MHRKCTRYNLYIKPKFVCVTITEPYSQSSLMYTAQRWSHKTGSEGEDEKHTQKEDLGCKEATARLQSKLSDKGILLYFIYTS